MMANDNDHENNVDDDVDTADNNSCGSDDKDNHDSNDEDLMAMTMRTRFM